MSYKIFIWPTRKNIFFFYPRVKIFLQVAQLEAESRKIVGIYGAAQLESHRAIQAARVYNTIVDALKAARNSTRNAQQLVVQARDQLQSLGESAARANKASAALRTSIDAQAAIDVAEMR